MLKCKRKSEEITPRSPLIRDHNEKPVCPFCGQLIDPPKELRERRMQEMPVGICSCGAVYAFDATGHNLGTAFNEALVFSCNMDWDLAFDLLPEDDYLQKIVENYDPETHLIIPDGFHKGRKIPGGLYFIRLHDDVQEVTLKGVKEKMNRATPFANKNTGEISQEKQYTKKDLKEIIAGYHVDNLLELAKNDKRIIRDLQRFLYSSNKLFRFKAADLFGKASAVIAKNNPSVISKLLKNMLSSMRDTGASSWGAIDTIGEIIKDSPGIFAGYVPELQRLLDRDKSLQPPVLRALSNIAYKCPDCLIDSIYVIIPFLYDSNPRSRGYAAQLLGNLKSNQSIDGLKSLIDEKYEIDIYSEGNMVKKTIGQIAKESLGKLQ
ncbi:MAG: HEAT repeat domain-containing protein [Clostridiales bacterium]|nr:HEAT repeat domain-containing protein [Clostridiales bacterium]MCF8022511.1 HEAT repeat domain-containing protein [Clostridiales bacterium]